MGGGVEGVSLVEGFREEEGREDGHHNEKRVSSPSQRLREQVRNTHSIVTMYSYNNHTEAISCRLAPGLKDRIDFECAQHHRMNRNRFLNDAAQLLLDVIFEVRCGNVAKEDLPGPLQRYLTWL